MIASSRQSGRFVLLVHESHQYRALDQRCMNSLLLLNHKSSSNNTQAAEVIASKNLENGRGFK